MARLTLFTPYFRYRDLAEALNSAGVELVAPATYGRYSEVTALTPEQPGAIQASRQQVVLDVGGNDEGAPDTDGRCRFHQERLSRPTGAT